MSLFRRLRHLLRRRQSEADMAEEMRFHLDQRAADYAADGRPADEARSAARRRFGNLGSIQEQAREAHGWGWLERWRQDLRFAFRHLVKSPAFSLLAVLTLALGIGANTAMFEVLDNFMLKKLPYRDSGQLDAIYRATAQNPEGSVSPADFRDLQREPGPYDAIGAYAYADTSLAEPGQPAEMPRAVRVTAKSEHRESRDLDGRLGQSQRARGRHGRWQGG